MKGGSIHPVWGFDVELECAVDVVVIGGPGERGYRLTKRGVAVERCPDVGGLGEGIRSGWKAAGDDGEEIVERVDAFVLAGGSAGEGSGPLTDLGHEEHPVDTGACCANCR